MSVRRELRIEFRSLHKALRCPHRPAKDKHQPVPMGGPRLARKTMQSKTTRGVTKRCLASAAIRRRVLLKEMIEILVTHAGCFDGPCKKERKLPRTCRPFGSSPAPLAQRKRLHLGRFVRWKRNEFSISGENSMFSTMLSRPLNCGCDYVYYTRDDMGRHRALILTLRGG